TFDKLSLDLSRGMFAAGQLYVALSRVRTLDGLYLSKNIIPQYAHTNHDIMTYAHGYNNIQLIKNEIESGKAVYNALHNNDYDEAAKQYLMLVYQKVKAGDMTEAMQQAKRFLDIVICDDNLMGCINEVPESVLSSNHWTSQFLAALLSLYAGYYEQALNYADDVLCSHHCHEILYIKSRALAMLKRYKEADEINVQMGDVFDIATPDAKVLFTIAIINELYIGDPGLSLIQKLVEIKPKYDKGIHTLRMLMKRHNIMLDSPQECKLLEAFNSDIDEKAFDLQLQKCRAKAKKEVSYLIQRIKKQEFNEE
ncbi:MAG: hypothetical protein ACI3ZV_03725, partial [Paludibacteraceae bacterium]